MGHNGQLVWDERFDERPQKDQIDYLKKLCSSQNHALDLMQKERNALLEEVDTLKAAAVNADAAFQAQKEIVVNLVTKSNEDKEQYAKRIQELEADGNKH